MATTFTSTIVPKMLSTDTDYNPVLREWLSSATMIAQTETPFLSKCRRRRLKMSRPRFEWQLRDLNNFKTSGVMTARPYGDKVTPMSVNQPKRRSNVAQTQWAAISVAKEEESADKWQMGSRIAYEMMRKSIEMRKAVESIILTENQSAREATTANSNTPHTATLSAIVGTNSKIGVTANSITPNTPGWDSTTNRYISGTRASTDAGRVELSYSDMRSTVDKIWEDVSTLTRSMSFYMSLAMKNKFDTFEGESKTDYEQIVKKEDSLMILSCIDYFKTTAGTFSVEPLPHMNGSSTVWCTNPSAIVITGYFFNFMFTLGRQGLSTERGIAWNWGLEVTTEAGMAALYDRKPA